MIKHKELMAMVNTGEPFDCTYCKTKGELAEYKAIRKYIKVQGQNEPEVMSDRRKARNIQSYTSLIPFVFPDGSIRELYTRAFVKFNNEEVIL